MNKTKPGELIFLTEITFDEAFQKLIGTPDKPKKTVGILDILEFIEIFNRMFPGANLNVRDFHDPKDPTDLPSFRRFLSDAKSNSESCDVGFTAEENIKAIFAYNYVFAKIFDSKAPNLKAIEGEFDIKIDPKLDVFERMRLEAEASETNYKQQAYQNIIRLERIKTGQLLFRIKDLSSKIRKRRDSKTALGIFRAVVSSKIDQVFQQN